MNVDDYLIRNCQQIAEGLRENFSFLSSNHTINDTIDELSRQCDEMINVKNIEDSYGKPMVWIGLYIAVASLFCILPMAADLLHGFRTRKLWFPCKYFTLNAASITVITVAMKLPVDLNTQMSGEGDQLAKLGSLYFLCIMMANLMPSLASMDNKQLLANLIGLAILVITVIVNTYIGVTTGIIGDSDALYRRFRSTAYLYTVMLLLLLIILGASAIMIPTSKQILESKYQAIKERTLNDQHRQDTRIFTFEELTQHVRRYWVMRETGNPQFAMVSNPLCSAASVISVIGLAIYIPSAIDMLIKIIRYRPGYIMSSSDYKWSTIPINVTQLFGIIVGTIAPVFRSFAVLNSKLSIKWSWNHMKVFIIEKYWTQKLFEWKQRDVAFPLSGRRSRTLVYNLKNVVLNVCIGFQKVIVVSSKMIGLLPIVPVIFVVFCLYCLKLLKAVFFAKTITSIWLGSRPELEQNDTNEDISNYVLQLQEETELTKRTLKTISNSMNRLIQNAEKQQHSNLLRLLEKSTGFQGVEKFDSGVELVNCWSLPVVTLTCITIALPSIQKNEVDNLLSSVAEGLFYVRLLEGSLNTSAKSVIIQRATNILWHEVEYKCKWLENTLQRKAYEGKTLTQILEWFVDKAKEIVDKVDENTNQEPTENSHDKLIVANSMYRITKTIMLNNTSIIEQNNSEELFRLLSGMIADILAACLTNLPQVIVTKCHESRIEKRGASIESATELLGRTKKIINILQSRELPSMDPDQMASIDEWRACLKQAVP